MRAVFVAVIALFAGVPDRLSAQEPLPPAAPEQAPALPPGLDVSRPLTPVIIPATDPPVEPDPVERVEETQRPQCRRRGPLGPSWNSAEYLLWWPKAHPVPPLVSAIHPGGLSPIVGGHALGTPAFGGGRFTLGSSLNTAETVGYELVYFFLGTRTTRATLTGANTRGAAFGLPYTNSTTGEPEAFAVRAPGVADGNVVVATSTRLQGAEVNAVGNVVARDGLRVNGLVGYRFLQVHEGLTITQLRRAGGEVGPIYDEFVAHNRFHGGQLGLHADLSHGALFCEVTGKLAIGQTFEMVRIDGATGVRGYQPGGVYALPSNIGRYTAGLFAVVPEGTLRVGLRFNDAGRFFVGYNFLYLSDVVRPGDQIDRVIAPAQIPALNPGGPVVFGDRPRPVIHRADFWAQGVVFGLETRY